MRVSLAAVMALLTLTGAGHAQCGEKRSAGPDDVRLYIFGHSLISHWTGSDTTTMPHWMGKLARASKLRFAVDGQYGFLANHADFDGLSPQSQWEFKEVDRVWDSERAPFAKSRFNHVMITPANFLQWQAPERNYPNESVSPLDRTLAIIDFVEKHKPGTVVWIYENWPDMSGFAKEGFPPPPEQVAAYHSYTRGDFHDWWLRYYQALRQARPKLDIRLIPVGPILAKLLTERPLEAIRVEQLYEDDAPHGRPTIYFLSGLVCFMSMYQREPPTSFVPPEPVHPLVRKHFKTIVSTVAQALTSDDLMKPSAPKDGKSMGDRGSGSNRQERPEPGPED